MLRRRVSALLAAAALCVGACTSTDDKPKADDGGAAEQAKTDKPDEPAPPADAAGEGGTKRVEITKQNPPTVTVDEAGSDPKRELRLSPAVGTEETMEMVMEVKMKMSMAGQNLPAVSTPPIIIDARGKIDELTDDELVLTYTVESMKVGESKDANPAVVETMKSMLEGMQAFSAHLEMDRRGTLKSGYVDVPQGLPAPMQQMVEQMQQSLGQIQVPLPEEAVGAGAKWTAVSNVEQGGMKLEQTASYELKSLEGELAKLEVTVKQKLLDDTFSPPGMEGIKAKIEMFQSGGKGSLALALDHWAPEDFHSDIQVKMGLTMDMMGQTTKQDVDMTMGLTMARK